MKTLRPVFIFCSIILVIGLACTFGTPTPTKEPPTKVPPTAEPTVAEPPTQAPEPTAAQIEAPEATATDEPAAANDFYIEEFDGDISNYTYFELHELGTSKTDNTIIPTTKNGALVFDLKKANKWVYVTYDPYTYTDVRLDIKANNRGKNNNNVSLICRYSEEGWYEFNIANNGLYWIYAYLSNDGYQRIYNGGSNLIKQGKDVNEYTMICNGDDITVGVNGVEVKTITDTKYKLPEGKVGLGVSSFDVLPILVNVESFQISQP
jgi:hypothetical protein